jgi:hypothetical protein
MHMMRRSFPAGRIVGLVLLLAGLTAVAAAAPPNGADPANGPLRKKLIEYGWDVPNIQFIHDHLNEMTRLPFDGIVFRLNGQDHAFDTHPWSGAAMDAQVDTLAGLDWGSFTDNFLCLYAANRDGMDWANEGQWEVICANLQRLGAAARRAGCVGICFDPEPYGTNPWTVPSGTDAASFSRQRDLARRRGAQFMAALQEGMPRLKVLGLYQLAMFAGLANEPDPARRDQILASHNYALYLPFIDGMLDAVGPDTRLIDGNEMSYYYEGSLPYYRAFHTMRQGVAPLVSPANRAAYRAHVDAGQALYVDQVLGLRAPATRFLSHFMEPADQRRWFAHNVYWALETSDEYVWCYSERMNWWTGQFMPGLDDAIRSAREELARPGTADVQIEPVLARARERMDVEIARLLRQPEVTLAGLPRGAQPPVVDGDLTEAAWAVTPLDAFVAPAGGAAPGQVTTVRATYDTQNLYLAWRCADDAVDSLVVTGRSRDDEVWNGDTVELFISLGEAAEPYVHFILNPGNVGWDGRSGGLIGDSSWDGTWHSATRRDATGWSAELAIPWPDLGGVPAPGTVRRVNLCRQRILGNELSTWSTVVQGFIEPTHFGTWRFGADPKPAR